MSPLEHPLDFRSIFEASPGLYLLLEPHPPRFTIVGASDAYLEGTLTERDAVVGRDIFDVFPDNPDDPEADGVRRLRESLLTVVETRAPHSMAVQKYDIPLPEAQGGGFTERHWSPRNVPVPSPDGSVRWIIHTVEDVTAFVVLQRDRERVGQAAADLRGRTSRMEQEILRRQAELAEANTRLRRANTQLSAMDEAKTAFFSNISHELRTPLTLILAPVEAALASGRPASDPAVLEVIARNARRLLHLVNRTLDFSGLEVGRAPPRLEPTHLAEFTRRLVSPFDAVAARGGLRLKVHCPDLATPVSIDRRLWELTVLNLLSNAVKYTREGAIDVHLLEDHGFVVLEVQDSGAGIPLDERERIFERFHRVHGVEGRVHGGSGLGLALVREAVELMGGTVSVASELGVGSTFRVAVPYRVADASEVGAAALPGQRVDDYVREAASWPMADGEATPAAEEVQPTDREAESGRILVVDDNPDMRAMLRRLLAPWWRTVEARDGVEALDRVREAAPDLVISDVMMPRLDGVGLLRELRADPRTATIPILLLSARSGEEDRIEGIHTGADEYLTKPFSPRELVARVRTQLALAAERRRANAAATELAESRAVLLADLARKNQELEAFSHSVSHDLRAPLRAIDGFAQALAEDCGGALGADNLTHLNRIRAAAQKMGRLIDDLLRLSRLERAEFRPGRVDLSALATALAAHVAQRTPARVVRVEVDPGMIINGDANLLEVALENLLSNAWKFTEGVADPMVQIGSVMVDGQRRWFVRDNGAGFDPQYTSKLFRPFSRLHHERDFPGIGIGLVTVQRVIQRHGGETWAEGAPGAGATIWWTLGPAAVVA